MNPKIEVEKGDSTIETSSMIEGVRLFYELVNNRVPWKSNEFVIRVFCKGTHQKLWTLPEAQAHVRYVCSQYHALEALRI